MISPKLADSQPEPEKSSYFYDYYCSPKIEKYLDLSG